MKDYLVISPIKTEAGIIQPGKTVPLSDEDAAELVGLGAIELLPVAIVVDRQTVIIAAIGKLDTTNTDLWLKDGKPDTNAISTITGWPVTAGERDAAWVIVTAEIPAA